MRSLSHIALINDHVIRVHGVVTVVMALPEPYRMPAAKAPARSEKRR